jgi:GNAT superfamily N-acetyltransferase
MHIRKATVSDARAIAKIAVDTWRSTYQGIVPQEFLDLLSYENRARRWKQMLENESDAFTYVAEDESEGIVGFANGCPERTDHPNYEGELAAIYVLDTYQKQGIGQSLVKAIAQTLVEMGHTTMMVWVLKDNPARGFYDAISGQIVEQKQVEIGGVSLTEVAYGWTDLRSLLTTL